MNKLVQILFFIALIPMLGMAREETMEERKRRVTRKYLRERMDIAQSDMMVPEELAEDFQITDSEKFKEVEIDLQRQEPGTMPLPRPPRRPAPLAENNNWLLIDTELEDDPYANPFDTTDTQSKDNYWEMWGGTANETSRDKNMRREQRYDPYSTREKEYDPRAQARSEQGLFKSSPSSTDRSGSSVFGNRQSIFGRQQNESIGGELGAQGMRTYGSDPDNGLLASPFSRTKEPEPSRSLESQRYTPYKSSYETERQQRQQQWGKQEVPKQEYKKPDSYQQWKDRSKAWDPTRDDAYLDELMEKNRR